MNKSHIKKADEKKIATENQKKERSEKNAKIPIVPK